MNIKINYNAIFEYADDGINITFPDIEEAITCAFSKSQALEMSKEVLDLVLHGKTLLDLPKPTPKNQIKISGKTEVHNIKITMGIKDGVLFGFNVIELSKNDI